MTLKAYPKYKDSGIDWVGKIPEHWQLIPLYACSNVKKITGDTDRELLSVYLNKGVIKFSEVADKRTNVTSEDLSKYQSVDPGDFVLNNQQAWRGSVGVSKYSGIVSPAYLVLRLDSNIDSDFANKLFRDTSMVTQYLINSKGVGTIQRNLYWPHLKRASTFFPPKDEQKLIARYLVHINNKIQKYISAKRKIIKLLEEEKQAIIHQVVTGVINVKTDKPYSQYKQVNLKWASKIPEDWKTVRLKSLFDKNVNGIWGEEPNGSDDLFCVRVADFDKDTGTVSLNKKTMRAISEKDRYNRLLNQNDLLLEKSGGGELQPVGNVVRYNHEIPAVCSNFIARLVVNPNFSSTFVYYLLRSMYVNGISNYSVKQTTGIQNLDTYSYFLETVIKPPLDDQKLISDYLDRTTVRLNKIKENISKEILFMQEYKTSLISDVVTGKVDVRKVASTLPDELKEVIEIDSSDEEIIEDELEVDENESN